jgi:hypothetical protein
MHVFTDLGQDTVLAYVCCNQSHFPEPGRR